MRAHKQSKYGIENFAKAITVDKYDCFIFVRCQSCGKIMDVTLDDTNFDPSFNRSGALS